MAATDVTIWTNPRCSKCRGAEELLADAGVDVERIRYLDDPPTRADIEHVLKLLGTADPRDMMRTSEPLYRELALAEEHGGVLIDTMSRHPILIQRPIVIRENRAVIARPPELLLALITTT